MERELGLHQITAMEASPVELLSIAAAAGCTNVCLFTHVPAAALSATSSSGVTFPLVTREDLPSILEQMKKTGVGVSNIEFFPISPDDEAESYRNSLALGAQLGANRAVVHIHHPDDDAAVERLRQVADLAAEYGLSLGLEFMGITPFCNSLQRALWFVEAADRDNVGIAVDALHLVRTGGTPEDLKAIAPDRFSYAQICDGHGLHKSDSYLSEALGRVMPGDGDFPLQAIIEALPAATPLDVEVPLQRQADNGFGALDRAREAVERARAIVDRSRTWR